MFDGADGAAATELTLDAGVATTVLSRGMLSPEVEKAFTISGDAELGSSAVAAIARMASGGA